MKTENLLLLALGAGAVYFLYNRSRVPVVPRVLPPNSSVTQTNIQTLPGTQTLQANITTLQSNTSPYGNAAPTDNNIIDFLTNG